MKKMGTRNRDGEQKDSVDNAMLRSRSPTVSLLTSFPTAINWLMNI